MESFVRRALFSELDEYCYLSEEGSYVEVTEWSNGEGFDAIVSSKTECHISLTWGEFDLLCHMARKLEKSA